MTEDYRPQTPGDQMTEPPETVPFDLGELDQTIERPKLPVALPKSKTWRVPRDLAFGPRGRLRDSAELERRQERRRDVRVSVLVRLEPVADPLPPGLWWSLAKSTHPSSWSLLPWDDEALAWAREHDVSTVDADVLMLRPVRS